MRISSLQKFCKNFDGSKDCYDHVAQHRHLVFAKGVENVHTVVQGFGLTMKMERKALAWF